jgi:hypothetical protein
MHKSSILKSETKVYSPKEKKEAERTLPFNVTCTSVNKKEDS